MSSPAATLQARLNSMFEDVGERSLWHDLNERLRCFSSSDRIWYSVRRRSDSSLPAFDDVSVILLRWNGWECDLFLDDAYFDPAHSTQLFILDRAFVVAVASRFAARFGERDSGEVLVALHDWGRPDMLSFTSGSNASPMIPDPPYLSTFAHDVFRAKFSEGWIPWGERERRAIWRGGLHGIASFTPSDDWSWIPRAHLCATAEVLEHADAIDAKLTRIDPYFDAKFPEHARQALRFLGDEIAPYDHVRYRYTIDVDGWANAWMGLFLKLLAGSAVLKVASQHGYRQWYYDRLEPWVNFVPVRADLADLDDALAYVLDHDAKARAIGMAGRQLALSLSLEAEIFAMALVLERAPGSGLDERLAGAAAEQ